jgi:hypothetical protein
LRTEVRRKKQKLIRMKLNTRKRRRILLMGEREVIGVKIVVHVGGISVDNPGEPPGQAFSASIAKTSVLSYTDNSEYR